MADDAGALLLRAGLIAEIGLVGARDEKSRRGGTIPERLVERGAIADETLTQFLSTHFMVPRLDPDALSDIPNAVLARLPADLAIELRAMPVAIDGESNLTVALSDPSDEHIVEQIRFFTGSYVVRAVCTQMQLAWSLAHYHGHLTDLGRSLALAMVNPAAAEAPHRRGGSIGFGDEVTEVTGPIKRIRQQTESPVELAPRSGEIQARPVTSEPRRLPAVVVDELDDSPSGPLRLGDPEPVLLERTGRPVEIEEVGSDGRVVRREAVPGEFVDDVLLLHSVKASRPRRPTAVGVGRAGTGDPTESEREAMMMASSTGDAGASSSGPGRRSGAGGGDDDGGKRRARPSRAAAPRVDDGWDADDWGPPGTTIPPTHLGAVPESYEGPDSSRIPLAIDDAASDALSRPVALPVAVEVADTERQVATSNPDLVDASASRLLVALHALEGAGSRDAVLDAALTFIAGATPRAGFAAVKRDRLSGYRGPGGIARDGDVGLDAGGLGAALSRPAPFRGWVSGPEAVFAANLLGALTPEVSAAPVVLRARLIGAFVAEAVPALVDEHLAVVARATGLALERVLKAQKR